MPNEQERYAQFWPVGRCAHCDRQMLLEDLAPDGRCRPGHNQGGVNVTVLGDGTKLYRGGVPGCRPITDHARCEHAKFATLIAPLEMTNND